MRRFLSNYFDLLLTVNVNRSCIVYVHIVRSVLVAAAAVVVAVVFICYFRASGKDADKLND